MVVIVLVVHRHSCNDQAWLRSCLRCIPSSSTILSRPPPMTVCTLLTGPISRSSVKFGSSLLPRLRYGPEYFVLPVDLFWRDTLECFSGVPLWDRLFCEYLDLPLTLLRKMAILEEERRDFVNCQGGRWWWSMRAKAGRQAVMTPTSISTSLWWSKTLASRCEWGPGVETCIINSKGSKDQVWSRVRLFSYR